LNVSIAFFKQLLHRQGVYATAHCRAPVVPLNPAQKRQADELIERVCGIEDALNPRKKSNPSP
jgi:4-hydroxy-tetrahydrodipicolinate synthase